jgi:uncharacterized membrane-anchored protein YitT (DUF2179 family)
MEKVEGLKDIHIIRRTAAEYSMLTAATAIMVVGVYFFKFPNNFCFGGVTGISVILSGLFHLSASSYTLMINMLLLLLGFMFLGKDFGFKTAYVTILMSAGLSLLDHFCPLAQPLTREPLLELVFAIILPAFSSALLFNMDASSGGTDIIAMIIKKYKGYNIGIALFLVDLMITVSACFVFDITTGLYSFCGLMAKTLVIDNVIESINLCKYFTIVSNKPEPICDYIRTELNRSSTIYDARGSYSGQKKTVILTVVHRSQAVQLRNYIRKIDPAAFIMITNSSEIIGNGFQRI